MSPAIPLPLVLTSSPLFPVVQLNGSELTHSKEIICQCLNFWQTAHCTSENISGVTGDLQTIGSFLCIWKHLYLRSFGNLHEYLFYKPLLNTQSKRGKCVRCFTPSKATTESAAHQTLILQQITWQTEFEQCQIHFNKT